MARKSTKPQGGNRCPVLKLAREYETLADAHERLDHPKAPAHRNVSAMVLIEDRLHAIAVAASYLIAESPAGAVFQLMIATDLNETLSLEAVPTPITERKERRVRRLLYRVKQHFERSGAAPMPMTESYLMPRTTDDLVGFRAMRGDPSRDNPH